MLTGKKDSGVFSLRLCYIAKARYLMFVIGLWTPLVVNGADMTLSGQGSSEWDFHAAGSVPGVYTIRYTYTDSAAGTGHVDFGMTVASGGSGDSHFPVGCNSGGSGTQSYTLTLVSAPSGVSIGGSGVSGSYEWTAGGCVSGGPSQSVTRNITLTAPPPSCTWSISGHFHRQCGTGPELTGNVTDGVVTYPLVLPADVTDADFSFDAAHESGGTLTITFNGATIATFPINCVGDPPPSNFHGLGTIIVGGPCPTPTPTPSPGTTPYPTATPHPTTSPLPSPSASPGTPGGQPIPPVVVTPGGQGQAVVVINPQDIYNPIVNGGNLLAPANNGTGGDGAFNGNNGAFDAGNYDTRGHLDELQGKLDQAIEKKGNAISDVTGKLDGMKSTITELGNQTFGSVAVIPMNFNLIGHATAYAGITLPYQIDLVNWLPMINVLREILLWLLRIGFFVMTFRLFAAQQVQAR